MVDFYKFYCETCGYTIMVSGQNGRGDLDGGLTIVCEDCKELYEIEPESSFTVKMKASHRMLRCPKNYMHRIRVWTFPGNCPKCGQPIKKGDHIIRWD